MASVYMAGDFRNGTTFEMDGNVYRVVEFQHVKPGKGSAFVRTKLKNVITGAVIALLMMKVGNLNKQIAEKRANLGKVFVLNSDVKSGQEITSEMLKLQEVEMSTVPTSAVGSIISVFNNYRLEDVKGNIVFTDENGRMYIQENNQKKYIVKNEDDYKKTSYYYEENKQPVELNTVPLVAKVALKKNTVLTFDLIARSNDRVTDDVRIQEYNVVQLPTQIADKEFIDIRLRLPNGSDYIVVSHKQIELPQIDGVETEDTIWLKLSEDEILMMSSAIVESYMVKGSKLYATRYVEAGTQEAATPTYLPNADVTLLMEKDPNIIQVAKNELFNRYINTKETIRTNGIDKQIDQKTAISNATSGTSEEIKKTQEQRKKYLQTLGGN